MNKYWANTDIYNNSYPPWQALICEFHLKNQMCFNQHYKNNLLIKNKDKKGYKIITYNKIE